MTISCWNREFVTRESPQTHFQRSLRSRKSLSRSVILLIHFRAKLEVLQIVSRPQGPPIMSRESNFTLAPTLSLLPRLETRISQSMSYLFLKLYVNDCFIDRLPSLERIPMRRHLRFPAYFPSSPALRLFCFYLPRINYTTISFLSIRSRYAPLRPCPFFSADSTSDRSLREPCGQ